MKKYVLILSLLFLSVVACHENDENERFMDSDEDSILTYLQKNTEYTEWYKIMERSGLAASYNYSSTPLTFFIMKNDVVTSYLKNRGYNSVNVVPVEIAKQLIQYHTVVNFSYRLEDFREGRLRDSTSSGDFLSCKLVYGATNENENGVFVNKTSKIMTWDIEAVNGVIHELNEVVDPVVDNLFDFLSINKERYSILYDAYKATGLDSLLTQLNRSDIEIKCRRTLFVTSDSIFEEKINVTTYAGLKLYLDAEDDIENPENKLNLHLRYRILDNDYSTSEFAAILSIPKQWDWLTVDAKKGTTIPTMAKNKLIQLRAEGIHYYFNESMFFLPDRYNIQLRNGFVHDIDGIWEIFEPESILTIVEPTNFLQFQLIPEYRHLSSSRFAVGMEAKDYTPTITWKSTPTDKQNAVLYSVWTKDAYNYKDQNKFIYGDCLWADLGPVGEVTVKTPPIAKGRYAVSILVKQLSKTGGFFQAFVDGEKVGGVLAGNPGGVYDNTADLPIETIVFEETKSHDITLSVVKPGELCWDLIRFVPVK